MPNVELPTTVLVVFYLMIIFFCIVVVAISIVIAPDLYTYFSSKGSSLERASRCNQYLDQGNTQLYETCLRQEKL